jgi:NAD(P)H-dependent FMN reductase
MDKLEIAQVAIVESKMQNGPVNILGVSGSMRGGSHSLKALEHVLKIASEKYGANVKVLNLKETQMPAYDPDSGFEDSREMKEATEAVNWADAFVLASPDYHGSMSGVMKNFLDHFWQEFSGKTFGYIVASHEKGLTVMDQMRTAVRQCYGWSMPYGVSVNGEQDITGGRVSNPRIEKRLGMLARDLAVYGKIIHGQFVSDLKGDEGNTFAAHFR